MTAKAKTQEIRWTAYNPFTRQYEEVDPAVDEFVEGQTILKEFKTPRGWVTTCASLFVLRNNEWVLDQD